MKPDLRPFRFTEITEITEETAVNNKIAPLGPLAFALRLRGAGRRTVFLVAAAACAALLLGIGLLLLA